MLFDILATVVAFIAVILLLSLIVTGLTQFATATLRLRVLNLGRALTILINDLHGGGARKGDVKPYVQGTITVASFGTLQAPKDMIAGLGLVRVSWIPSNELIACLEAAGVKLPPGGAEKTLENFKRLERYMEKRFALFARFITFAVALLVAIWFQVSSPELLHRLSADADLRGRYAAMGEQLLRQDADAPVASPAVARQQLAGLDVTPWKEGWAYYRGAEALRWDRIAGVLVTALLLTFGAPFWFERMKEMARLRDTMTGKNTTG